MTNDKLPVPSEGYGPAMTKLADTVRHVVDFFAGPQRIRAKAKAQADAEVILAEGRAQVQDIEARAIERLRKREVRRQQNIEAITVEAAKALPPPDEISGEPVSEDWTTRFFEECKDISDKEMQSLWARINFGSLTHLGSIGLLDLNEVTRFHLKKQTDIYVSYYGKRFSLRSTTDSQILDLGCVLLTKAGRELLSICGAQPNESAMSAAFQMWQPPHWTVEDLSAQTSG